MKCYPYYYRTDASILCSHGVDNIHTYVYNQWNWRLRHRNLKCRDPTVSISSSATKVHYTDYMKSEKLTRSNLSHPQRKERPPDMQKEEWMVSLGNDGPIRNSKIFVRMFFCFAGLPKGGSGYQPPWTFFVKWIHVGERWVVEWHRVWMENKAHFMS